MIFPSLFLFGKWVYLTVNPFVGSTQTHFRPLHSTTFKNVCICYRFSVYPSYMHTFVFCVTTIISSNIVFLHLFAAFCVHVCISVSLYLYTHQYTYIDSVIVCALTAIDHRRDQVISAALAGSKRQPFKEW